MIFSRNLIKRKKLIKFCFFFGGSLRSTFKINFFFCNVIYQLNCMSEYKILLLSIQKVVPLILTIGQNLTSSFLFLTSRILYSKTIKINKYKNFIKQPIVSGLVYNFLPKAQISTKQSSLDNLSVLVVLNCEQNKKIIFESKIKNIPIIGLVTFGEESGLLEYPIFVNKLFFHTIFFFTRFFFRLVVLVNNKR